MPDEIQVVQAEVEQLAQDVAKMPSPTTLAISESDWGAIVGAWIGNIRNSPVAQSTDGWNHLMAALPKLLPYVNAHLTKG